MTTANAVRDWTIRAPGTWSSSPTPTRGSPTTTGSKTGMRRTSPRPSRSTASPATTRPSCSSPTARPRRRRRSGLAQKALGFRYTMDVVPLDGDRVRGSHGRLPASPQDGPVLMCTDTALAGGPVRRHGRLRPDPRRPCADSRRREVPLQQQSRKDQRRHRDRPANGAPATAHTAASITGISTMPPPIARPVERASWRCHTGAQLRPAEVKRERDPSPGPRRGRAARRGGEPDHHADRQERRGTPARCARGAAVLPSTSSRARWVRPAT